MKQLRDQALELNVTVEVGDLPEGERARYIPSQRRIVLGMRGETDTYQALSQTLAHVRARDAAECPEPIRKGTPWPVNRSSSERGERLDARRTYLAAYMLCRLGFGTTTA